MPSKNLQAKSKIKVKNVKIKNKNKNGSNSRVLVKGRGVLPIRRVLTLDPLTSMHVARPIHRSTPYSVIREKVLVPFITPSTLGEYRTIVVAPFATNSASVVNNAGMSLSPIIACSYAGTGLPTGSGCTTFSSNLLSPANPMRLRLHRVCAEVQCLGTSAPTTVPDGQFFYGTLRTPIDPFAFASCNAIGAFLLSRLEVKGVSNMAAMYNPRRLHTHPLDQKSYDEFIQLATPLSLNTLSTHDSVAPMVFVFPQTLSGCGIMITLHVEWAVMYDNDPVLQSTATIHPTAPQTSWDYATDAVIAASGAAIATAEAGMRGAVGQARRVGGMAARAALGYGAEVAPYAILA